MYFSKIIYLLSTDIKTLKEISDLCGNKNAKEPLISIDELRNIKEFEAIILIPRLYPIKTILAPDYKINWGNTFNKISLKERVNSQYKIYKIK